MTTTVTLNRGEASAIPFTITDAANGLVGKRVTWAISSELNGKRTLQKVSGFGVTSSGVTISTINAGSITGFVNISVADYKALPAKSYYATLWVDDGAGVDRCVTPGGYDLLTINPDVPRT